MKKILIAVLFVFGFSGVYAQNMNVGQLLENRNFTFYANSTLPHNSFEISRVISKMAGAMNSGNIILNPDEYNVVFSKDKIKSQLPFYGRVYSAEMSSTDSGLKFESTNFTDKIKKNKRGSFQADYKINDAKSARAFSLNVQPNGQAMLIVTSNNRESITFNGYIKEN